MFNGFFYNFSISIHTHSTHINKYKQTIHQNEEEKVQNDILTENK